LSQTGEKTLDQLKYIEVPEEMVPLHTKGMVFAKYAMQLKDSVAPDPEDPLGEIVNLQKSKVWRNHFCFSAWKCKLRPPKWTAGCRK
jgi:hypothetical protein